MRIETIGTLLLIASCFGGVATAADIAMCPAPARTVQASCREITYKDLPQPAKSLLRKLKCAAGPGSNYDYGSAVDLNGDGFPEYQFCCHEASHGPCDARLIGKIGNEWKDLTGTGGMFGYDGACVLVVILESRHGGFHDVCLADGPTVWQFSASRYRAVKKPPAVPSK